MRKVTQTDVDFWYDFLNDAVENEMPSLYVLSYIDAINDYEEEE